MNDSSDSSSDSSFKNDSDTEIVYTSDLESSDDNVYSESEIESEEESKKDLNGDSGHELDNFTLNISENSLLNFYDNLQVSSDSESESESGSDSGYESDLDKKSKKKLGSNSKISYNFSTSSIMKYLNLKH